jgi:hypothetical protein
MAGDLSPLSGVAAQSAIDPGVVTLIASVATWLLVLVRQWTLYRIRCLEEETARREQDQRTWLEYLALLPVRARVRFGLDSGWVARSPERRGGPIGKIRRGGARSRRGRPADGDVELETGDGRVVRLQRRSSTLRQRVGHPSPQWSAGGPWLPFPSQVRGIVFRAAATASGHWFAKLGGAGQVTVLAVPVVTAAVAAATVELDAPRLASPRPLPPVASARATASPSPPVPFDPTPIPEPAPVWVPAAPRPCHSGRTPAVARPPHWAVGPAASAPTPTPAPPPP